MLRSKNAFIVVSMILPIVITSTEQLLPQHSLDITAEPEIYLEDVDRRLPEDDAVTAQTGHEVLRDDTHAGVRLRSQVRQDFLKVNRTLFTDLSLGY